MKYQSILGTIGNTPLVEAGRLPAAPGTRLWLKLEGQNPTGSVKDRIALAMIEVAESSDALTRGKTILEPTSGNTGIALAMVATLRGYPFTAVMPDNASPERVGLLRAYGASIVFSDGAKGTNGAVAKATEMAADDRYYMPFQYGNETNVRVHYETTGREILEDVPDLRAFVAGLGTGGTLTGVGRRLKEHDPTIRVIAAEPELGELVYGLRSLEDGYVPPIFDPDILDGKVKVRARDAIKWTRELLRVEGIFAGISAGAVIWVAQRAAAKLAELGGGDIVCLLPDGGWKYLSTQAWTEPIDEATARVEDILWW